jgi:hypothetical protein
VEIPLSITALNIRKSAGSPYFIGDSAQFKNLAGHVKTLVSPENGLAQSGFLRLTGV